MQTTTTTKFTNPSLTLYKGNYRLSLDAKKSRIWIEKKIPIYQDGRFSGSYEKRSIRIPLTRMVVCLMHRCGDVLTFRYTAMGQKVSVTRTADMTKATMVNTSAHGPDLIEAGGKTESTTLDKALATISRMTGMESADARRLFIFDLWAAGVVGR